MVRHQQFSVECIVTWIWSALCGFQISAGQQTFVNCAPQLYGPHSLPSNVYRGSFTGGKSADRETDHSPLTSADVKNGWRYNLHIL